VEVLRDIDLAYFVCELVSNSNNTSACPNLPRIHKLQRINTREPLYRRFPITSENKRRNYSPLLRGHPTMRRLIELSITVKIAQLHLNVIPEIQISPEV
jgi:hypothetical protein